MINKNRFGVANDKKLLRKIGKQWVTVSALTLVLLGGGAVASSVVTHADTTTPAVEAQDTNSIKEKINSNLDKAYQVSQSASGRSVASFKASQSSVNSSQSSSANKPSNVESKASNMHDTLMLNAANNSNNSSSSSASTESSVASSSSVSSSAKPSFNSAYQSYMTKMSGTDSEVASANDNNVQSNAKDEKKPLIKDINNDDSYFFGGGVKDTGDDDGLDYTAYNNGGIEFTSDSAFGSLSNFYYADSEVENAQALKFDDGINVSNVSDMSGMFSTLMNVQYIDLGNNFDTSNVTNMSQMFFDTPSLKEINLGDKFDTSKVTNMSMMFQNTSLQSLNLGNKFDTSNVTNMSDMFNDDTALQSFKLPSSFDTSNVTNMNQMFNSDSSLKSLNLDDKFNTSKVTNMSEMFANDSNLQSLTLPNSFDTSKVTDMSTMFNYDNIHSFIINSPLTKWDNTNTELENDYYKQLPEKDPKGKNYTLTTPNNFTQGNVGTFVTPANPEPTSDTATINYQINGKTVSSYTTPKEKFNSTTTTNKLTNIPSGYQVTNPSQTINYNGGTYTVPIEPIPSYFNVIEYTDSKGNPIGDTTAYGQKGTNIPNSIIENDIPKGYQVAQPLPVKFTDKNVVKVAVQSDNGKGDMVVGTAYLTLLYKKGNRTDGQVLRLHINGNIGDTPIVINPQDYDRDGYSIAPSDKDWHIPFDYNDVKKATNDFSRYNREHTFTYKANATDIKIQYVDTQTKSNIGSSDDLGQIAYDGDTADLQGTDDNNVLSVDGKEYHLNLPSGYHLAHSNNYITIAANSTYVKPVTTANGTRMLRMPLMKLTLGITPHFSKPTSNSSVAPKPSSASSATPQSASSASTESSSALVVPSSASQNQSVAPNSVTSSSMVILSSAASIASVTPSIASSSVTSTRASSSVALASVSVKPSSTNINPVSTIARPVTHHTNHKRIAKKPVTHRISHKKMAKHDSKWLNHKVTQDKHKLNIVERHMKARKAIIRKATHAKRVIKHAKRKLHYLRHNKRHVAHALRRITRNKVAIKRAKRVVRTAKQARPRFVHAKAAPVGPTTDKFTAPSVKASVVTPRAKSTATVHTNRKKLPQTSEATDHAGIVAIILMIMSVILAGFDKAFGREHN